MLKYEATNITTEEANKIVVEKNWDLVTEDKDFVVHWNNVTGELMKIAKSHCDFSIYTKQRRLNVFEALEAKEEAEKNKPKRKPWGNGYNDGQRR